MLFTGLLSLSCLVLFSAMSLGQDHPTTPVVPGSCPGNEASRAAIHSASTASCEAVSGRVLVWH